MSGYQEVETGNGFKRWSGRPSDYTCAGCNGKKRATDVRGDQALCPRCRDQYDYEREAQ